MVFLQILLTIFFQSSAIIPMVTTALYMVGLWRMFKKSGLKGWWALVPFAKDYQLSRCAGREPEGPVYTLSSVGIALLDILLILINRTPEAAATMGTRDMIISILVLSLFLVRFIYNIRIWSGLIEVYGVKKRWMWLWLLSPINAIPAMIWGFNP